jgi:hypothetical protein
MEDFGRTSKRPGDQSLSQPIKRLRPSEQPEGASGVVSTTISGDDRVALKIPAAQQFNRVSPIAASKSHTKTSAISEIPGGESVMAEMEPGDKAPPTVIKQRPFALPRRDSSDKSKMLQKVGLRGTLVYTALRAPGPVPVIAQTHQIKDMLRQGLATLEDKDMQDAILNAYLPPKFASPPKNKIFVIKEGSGSCPVYEELPLETYKKLTIEEQQYLGVLPHWNLTDREMFDLGFIEENQLCEISQEELRAENSDRARSEKMRPAPQSRQAAITTENDPPRGVSHVLQFKSPQEQAQNDSYQDHWQFKEADLYLLDPADHLLIDAMEVSAMYLDQPSMDKLVLTKSGQDHLRLTVGGSAALGDVPMIVREANGSYRLVRSEGVEARTFDGWTKKHGRNGVFLRDGEKDFLSVDRYNSIHGAVSQQDAARACFAVITGQSRRRVDLPRLMIEDEEGDFVGMHDYVNHMGAHSLRTRNVVILSSNGKALHSPWVSKKQDSSYFKSLMTSEKVTELLQGYNNVQNRKQSATVLVRVNDKLVKAEKLNVLNHRYGPLVDQHPEEDIFLHNYNLRGYTGNYAVLGKYSRPRLEQVNLLGWHPHSVGPHISNQAGKDAAERSGLEPRLQHSSRPSR